MFVLLPSGWTRDLDSVMVALRRLGFDGIGLAWIKFANWVYTHGFKAASFISSRPPARYA